MTPFVKLTLNCANSKGTGTVETALVLILENMAFWVYFKPKLPWGKETSIGTSQVRRRSVGGLVINISSPHLSYCQYKEKARAVIASKRK